jgi:hypothetical protein
MSDDRDARPKLSFSELDKRRRGEKLGTDEPRGRRASHEQARARSQALSQADAAFSAGQGGAVGERLARAMRDQHGTSDFPLACRNYSEEIGVPRDPSLLGLMLDSGERDLVVAALEALLEAKNSGSLEIGSGLRSQLRLLEQARDDTLAGLSEDLLQG